MLNTLKKSSKTKKKSETKIKAFQKCAKEDTSIVQLVRVLQPTSTPAQIQTSKKAQISLPKVSMVKIPHHDLMETDSPDNLIDETITSGAMLADDLIKLEPIENQQTIPKENSTPEVLEEKSIAHMKSPIREIARLSMKSNCQVHVLRLPSTSSNTSSEKLSPQNVKTLENMQKQLEERLSTQLKPFKALNESVYQPPQPVTITQPSRIMKPKIFSTSAIKVN